MFDFTKSKAGNAEKKADFNFINPAKTEQQPPEEMKTVYNGMGELKAFDFISPPSGMGSLREYDRVEPEANIGLSLQKGIIDRADTLYGGLKPPAGTEPNPWQLPDDSVYTNEDARTYQPRTGLEKAAYGAGGMVSDIPLFVTGQSAIGGPVTAKLLPKLGQLGARTAGAAATGAGIGGVEALAEGQDIPEALKTVGASAAMWGGGELGLGALGAGFKALRAKPGLPKIESLSLPKTLPELPPPRASLRTGTQDYAINNAMGFETGTKSLGGRTDWIPPVFNRSGGQVSTVPAPKKPLPTPSGYLEAPAIIRGGEAKLNDVPFFDSTETGRVAGEQFIPFAKAQGAKPGGFSSLEKQAPQATPVRVPRITGGPPVPPTAKKIDPLKAAQAKKPEKDSPQEKLLTQHGINIAEKLLLWVDKSKFALGRETPERNFEAVMGKDAPEMIKKFIDPVHKSESDRMRWLNSERESIASLGIKPRSKESELVQKYGEKLINEVELQEYAPKDWQKIKAAAEVLRGKYDSYLYQINTILRRNEYAPIPKREDYFRHFEDVTSLFEQYGIPKRKIEDLPTSINGITADFRPGKNFFANALRRKTNKTSYDAITGIDGYLEGSSRVMFHTDNIQRLRTLDRAIRMEAGDGRQLSNFAADLTEYTNNLAGKKAMFDRATESVFGRTAYVTLDWLKRRTGANMIGANLSSALTQFIPLTQSLATTSKPAMLKSLKDTLGSIIKDDGFIGKSDFLTRRLGSDPLSLNLWDKASQKASWPFRVIDRFASEAIVRGKYYEGISKGMKPAQAIDAADKWAARVMADRSLGAMPTLFNSRTLGVFTQFQLEVNNQISFLLKDIPASSETKLAMASSIAQLFLYGYLYNSVFEKVVGYRPALDPVGVAQKAYEDYSNPGIDKSKATKNLIGNVANQLPFSSTFTGGRIPIGAALPNPLAVASGESPISKELLKPATYLLPPFGGGQAKKVIEGAIARQKGGVYQDDKLKFPVTKNPSLYLFGPGNSPEGKEYYREDKRMLSTDQTAAFEKAVSQGKDPKQLYNQLMLKREIDGLSQKIAAVKKDGKLTPEEKQKEIQKLNLRLGKLKMGGK